MLRFLLCQSTFFIKRLLRTQAGLLTSLCTRRRKVAIPGPVQICP